MKRHLLLLLAALLAAAAPTRGDEAERGLRRAEAVIGAEADVPAYHALIIGIDAYTHWPPLRRARQDAETIAALLRTRYGFSDVTTLYDGEATRERIDLALRALTERLTVCDALLIYFSGHGFYDRTVLKKGYWIPVDGREQVDGQPATMDWFKHSDLKEYLGQMQARHVLVLSDACFSGALFRGVPPELAAHENAWYRRAIAQPSRWAISSGALEPVPDESVFARKLIDALQYPLKPVFSASDLAGRIKLEVAAASGCQPLFGPLDDPNQSQNGEFVFLLRDDAATPAAVTNPPAATAGQVATPANPAAPVARDAMTVDLGGGIGLEFVWIPPGAFRMGSPPDELGRDAGETPHQVTLSKGFWMGKYEVTQAQWQQVMAGNPSRFPGARNPVERVSWNDCQEFLRKLNLQTGRSEFRLPTEAEWEYACRAGTATAFNNGQDWSGQLPLCPHLDAVGWHAGNSQGTPHPVGGKAPNAWGLYDMHGNVWEWCQDRQGGYPEHSVTDPAGPWLGATRSLRGGSWFGPPSSCRSAYRGYNAPADSNDNIGFRVVAGGD